MLTELNGKGGQFCQSAKEGKLRCPLILRSTSEDVITGNLSLALNAINPRWWLPDILNTALGHQRFRRQIYRRLRIEPWVNQPPFPRELLPWKEGSTEVDLMISWNNPPTLVFIEAKYQADLSKSTSNSTDAYPADQLIRNARVGLQASGYYEKDCLFEFKPHDFVLILLTPSGRHPLVDEYRNETKFLNAIPKSDQLIDLPRRPFIGQLTYRQIESSLQKNCRWLNRAERSIARSLIDYLEFKRNHCKPKFGTQNPKGQQMFEPGPEGEFENRRFS